MHGDRFHHLLSYMCMSSYQMVKFCVKNLLFFFFFIVVVVVMKETETSMLFVCLNFVRNTIFSPIRYRQEEQKR